MLCRKLTQNNGNLAVENVEDQSLIGKYAHLSNLEFLSKEGKWKKK